MTLGNKIGIWLLVLMVLAAGGYGYYYYFVRVQPAQVTLKIVKPDQVLVGQQFNVTVSYSNDSQQILQGARVSLTLPDGVEMLGNGTGVKVSEQLIEGDIVPGSLGQKTFNLIALDGAQSVKQLKADLNYTIGGNQNQFSYEASADLSVGQPAVSLNLTAPQSVLSGQEFPLAINYQNNSSEDFKNVNIKVVLPQMYSLTKADPIPNAGGTNWQTDVLQRNNGGQISLGGSYVGQEASFFNVVVTVTADYLGKTYTLNSQTASVGISQAPLSLSIKVNESSSYTAKMGDGLTYTLSYKNNSQASLKDVTIRATLVSPLLDLSTLRFLDSKGSFDSVHGILGWNTAASPSLAALDPGESGSVTFSVILNKTFSFRRLSDKNYSVKLQATIQSPTVPPGVSASKTISVASSEVKIMGQADLASYALFYDAASGIVNKGLYPARANKATQYTVHWQIKNYSTDLSAVHVSAFLQSGAKFTGTTKSTTGAQPAYNAGTGEVTWDIPLIPATKGFVGSPAEAIFQIEFTPSVNMVNKDAVFLGDANLTATDSFTSSTITASAVKLDTSLPQDTKAGFGVRTVQP